MKNNLVNMGLVWHTKEMKGIKLPHFPSKKGYICLLNFTLTEVHGGNGGGTIRNKKDQYHMLHFKKSCYSHLIF